MGEEKLSGGCSFTRISAGECAQGERGRSLLVPRPSLQQEESRQTSIKRDKKVSVGKKTGVHSRGGGGQGSAPVWGNRREEN